MHGRQTLCTKLRTFPVVLPAVHEALGLIPNSEKEREGKRGEGKGKKEVEKEKEES